LAAFDFEKSNMKASKPGANIWLQVVSCTSALMLWIPIKLSEIASVKFVLIFCIKIAIIINITQLEGCCYK
jgi:predicted transglutaminase-like protease